jgi:hypothetical protein
MTQLGMGHLRHRASLPLFIMLFLPREMREHRIFQTLLRMVPGLESRIMSSSDDEVRLVADLVRIPHTSWAGTHVIFLRFRKGSRVQDRTTQRA